MSVVARRVTATTTPTRLDCTASTDAQDGKVVCIRNTALSTPVYLGGSDVTASTGFSVPASETLIGVPLAAGDPLYVVTATGTASLHVLEVGV